MRTFAEIVELYGKDAKQRLQGPGEKEALLLTPVTSLIEQYATLMNRTAVMHNEVRELDNTVRPDFGVRVNGSLVGHVELKAPGTNLDPASYGKTTHNFRQWQRLRELPNLLHTNGIEFRLWRYGTLVDDPIHLHARDLARHTGPLLAPGRLEGVLSDFLSWSPTPVTSIRRLVDTIAPLARLLREEVHDALQLERKAARQGASVLALPFTGVKNDWRQLLFPRATDREFSDGFAQTVVFALLLAVSEDIDLQRGTLRDVSRELDQSHTLMARALDILIEHVEGTAAWNIIEIVVRTLAVTNWSAVNAGTQDVYLHLYEHFLEAYDPELRQLSGSYYTPVETVDSMVRISDLALKNYLGKHEGLRHPSVNIVDPAMGTGTYPLSVLRHAGESASAQLGPGAASEAVTDVAGRIHGIELQSGPFSVAELRISQAIREYDAAIPRDGLNLYVADTLEDPAASQGANLSYTLQLVADQRQRANRMKREKNVEVCIGNPPYKDHAGGMGGWVESGVDPQTGLAPLDAFRLAGNGGHERTLSNLYVYFWRWATWKVFESTQDRDGLDDGNGVICFITATGYLTGPGFRGMREYLRRTCSHGWIINVSPEGLRPPAGHGVFGIETPVVIAMFIRQQGTKKSEPARIRYTSIEGKRAQKFQQLNTLELDGDHWKEVRSGWTDPFTPAATTSWDSFPRLDDLIPFRRPGVMTGRNWIYSPSKDILEQRMRHLVNEDNWEKKAKLFVNGDAETGASLKAKKNPLCGSDVTRETKIPVGEMDVLTSISIVPCGYRAFDRQYLIADSRLMNRASPELWRARIKDQLFAIELHSEHPKAGPGVVFSALIPDVHHFRGSGGGRTFPMLDPDGVPNIAEGLTTVLSRSLRQPVLGEEVLAYLAAVAGHSGFVAEFDEELHTPGVRLPVTSNPQLWNRAVENGNHLIWLHTFGARGHHPAGWKNVLEVEPRLNAVYAAAVQEIPKGWRYEPISRTLSVGTGRWEGVGAEVMSYKVGGTEVVPQWLNFRKEEPDKLRTSPLDEIDSLDWIPEWSEQLTELLAMVRQLCSLERDLALLLQDVLASPLLTREELESRGVAWPAGDRRSWGN